MWKFILLSLGVVSTLASGGFALAIDVDEHGLVSNSTSEDERVVTEPRSAALFVNNKMYYVVFARLNWHSAAEYCSSQNLILASITSADDNAKLLEKLFENELLLSGASFWVGASDVGHNGRWTWLSNGRPLLYRNWQPGEPNNQRGIEHCMELLDSGKWNDENCNKDNFVICENRCPLDSYSAPLYK